MKNVKNIFLVFIGLQLFVAEGSGERSVGRPRTKQTVPEDSIASKRKPGRLGYYGPKPDNRLMVPSKSIKALTVVEQIMPSSFTAVKTLGSGARLFRRGLIGATVVYVGENVYRILTDDEKKEAIKKVFFPKNVSNQEDFVNNNASNQEDFVNNNVSNQEDFVNNNVSNQEDSVNNNVSNQEDVTNNQETVTNSIDQIKSSVMPTHVAFYNTPLVKGGVGALCVAGLGYVAYKIYEKIHEKYFKKNNALNNVIV